MFRSVNRESKNSKELIRTWVPVEMPVDESRGFVFGNAVPQSVASDYEKVLLAVQSDAPNFRISGDVGFVLCVT